MVKFGQLKGFRKFRKEQWGNQKRKGAAFLKIAEKMGGKGILHQVMNRRWYRHINKVLEGKSTSQDEKHWKRMTKNFKKEIVGIPSDETLELLEWLKGFSHRVKKKEINEEDMTKWLPQFKSYMESCEANGIDNYIIKEKMLEV